MRVVLYESSEPLRADERFMAFLVSDTPQNGNAVSSHSCLLPVRFCAGTAQGAHERALRFWDDETAKERQKRERGEALGARRRRAA
jgi:hypothetical protein